MIEEYGGLIFPLSFDYYCTTSPSSHWSVATGDAQYFLCSLLIPLPLFYLPAPLPHFGHFEKSQYDLFSSISHVLYGDAVGLRDAIFFSSMPQSSPWVSLSPLSSRGLSVDVKNCAPLISLYPHLHFLFPHSPDLIIDDFHTSKGHTHLILITSYIYYCSVVS